MAESESLLAISVDTKTVRSCLVEQVAGAYRLIAWKDAPSNHRLALTEQVAQVSQDLGVQLGRVLWNEVANEPLLFSKDPTRYPPITQVVGAASPHPPLRIWFVALSADESLAAALRVVDLCQAQVVGQTILQASSSVELLESQLLAAEPDAIIIVGGYDNPEAHQAESHSQDALLYLSSLALQALVHLQEEIQPVLIYAGNRFAAEPMTRLSQQFFPQWMSKGEEESTFRFSTVDNVRPAPDQIHLAPLAQALRAEQQQLYNQSAETLALSKLLTSPAQLTSLETSFIQFARGWLMQKRLDSLHALYCGSLWWLHVWVQSGQQGGQQGGQESGQETEQSEVRICFINPGEATTYLANWPPLQLVSGPWPDSLWSRPQQHWWDQNGLVPLLATIGQVEPLAMLQVMYADLLEGSK